MVVTDGGGGNSAIRSFRRMGAQKKFMEFLFLTRGSKFGTQFLRISNLPLQQNLKQHTSSTF